MLIAHVQFAQGGRDTSGAQTRSSSTDYEGSLFARTLDKALSAAGGGRNSHQAERPENQVRTDNSQRPEHSDDAGRTARENSAKGTDNGDARETAAAKAEATAPGAAVDKAAAAKSADAEAAAAKSAKDEAAEKATDGKTAEERANKAADGKAEATRNAEKTAGGSEASTEVGSLTAEKASHSEQSRKTQKSGEGAAFDAAGKRIAENLIEKDGAETAKEAEELADGVKDEEQDRRENIDVAGAGQEGAEVQRETVGAAATGNAGSQDPAVSTANLAGSEGGKIAANPDGDGGNSRRGERPGHDAKAVTLEVRDYRNREAANRQAGDRGGQSSGESLRGDAGKGEAVIEPSAGGDSERDGPQIRLVRSWANGSEWSEPAARGARGGGFSAYLRDAMNPQIVKQSGIILRNNNRGEIRLVLQPEHLGRVRLRIQLDENRLSGRIFVDSNFVKESFEQNLSSLYRAFRESGYETTEFEVLVDSGEQEGSRESSPEGTPKGHRRGNIEAAAKTVQQLDDAVPILEQAAQSDLVNLVV